MKTENKGSWLYNTEIRSTLSPALLSVPPPWKKKLLQYALVKEWQSVVIKQCEGMVTLKHRHGISHGKAWYKHGQSMQTKT